MRRDEFKAWRIERHFTQPQAATYLEVSRVTVARWESGASPVPDAIARMIAGSVPVVADTSSRITVDVAPELLARIDDEAKRRGVAQSVVVIERLQRDPDAPNVVEPTKRPDSPKPASTALAVTAPSADARRDKTNADSAVEVVHVEARYDNPFDKPGRITMDDVRPRSAPGSRLKQHPKPSRNRPSAAQIVAEPYNPPAVRDSEPQAEAVPAPPASLTPGYRPFVGKAEKREVFADILAHGVQLGPTRPEIGSRLKAVRTLPRQR